MISFRLVFSIMAAIGSATLPLAVSVAARVVTILPRVGCSHG